MQAIELTDRQRDVLRAVVVEHIRSAEPVGSRAITRRYRMSVSPATVRNVMVDLEDAGLLAQPHTSAGRVPTDLGYRVYVDRLMVPEALGREEISVLRAALVAERRSVESFLDEHCADDGNDCTADACTDYECVYPNQPSGTSCDDGLWCTADDECDGQGNCAGTADTCPPPRLPNLICCCEAEQVCSDPWVPACLFPDCP